MANYVYGCSDPEHPRWETHHKMNVTAIGVCHICGEKLHRIPQPFLWGVSPLSLIQAWSERNWSKKLRKEPREESYDSVRTNTGKPQKDFYARR